MTAPVDKLSREQLLDRLQAKAGCMHTQEEADSLWTRLIVHLTAKQRSQLSTAWGHHMDVREGREELDIVCGEIRKSWRGVEVAPCLR